MAKKGKESDVTSENEEISVTLLESNSDVPLVVTQSQQTTDNLTDEESLPDDSQGEPGLVILPGTPKRKAGRRKINIEYIEEKSRRHITFNKRKNGIIKKAFELSTLTGTQALLIIVSENGHYYTYASLKLQAILENSEGKDLLQKCFNTPDTPETHAAGCQIDWNLNKSKSK